jgi:hypothetical protein
MELNLTKEIKQIISVFLMIILPLIVIGLGILFEIVNAWYFILAIIWFAMGIIFFSTVN